MSEISIEKFIEKVIGVMPKDWQRLTTHRLDIYNEELAKVEFLSEFEKFYSSGEVKTEDLENLPTAFDYIRLGHPLSCILEWTFAHLKKLKNDNVISFSSQTMPLLAVLRKNLLEKRATNIYYKNDLPKSFSEEVLKEVYGYNFELKKISSDEEIASFDGSNILLIPFEESGSVKLTSNIDFVISIHLELGSITFVNGEKNEAHIKEIQHVRRRESIAMTPNDCFKVLCELIKKPVESNDSLVDRDLVLNKISEITNTKTKGALGSCGLSIQYAIMMGLIDDSMKTHGGRPIKFIVPPNCYGGTNDQARRVAACLSNVEVLDLPVDSGQDMVSSVEKVLSQVADMDAVPFIIAEIPTNPRVEVPELEKLREALGKNRITSSGAEAIAPVFILDQTFCPNVKFLGEGDLLSSVRTISYVSGSKFPSGGLCTAGYCVANEIASPLMVSIKNHLMICGNEATSFQINILAQQMPSMNQRINDAYKGTRDFVNFIEKSLPEAKINFVSNELAVDGFTPSVFSLDLPTKGESAKERESFKRELNLNLIDMMIKEIPQESKHCVSYGQLKGCYWTIPATSTQGTTKEGDKDYIVRVAMSPDFDLDHHKRVFASFCEKYYS